jgi:2-oxoglutarate ferredoxin oxidoreductase subunit gamma
MGRKAVRLVGLGGQGMVTAGTLLGAAACLCDGLEAVQTTFYGPEIRGGEAGADVIVSTEPIGDLVVTELDALVCLWQGAYDKYTPRLAREGLVLLDADLVTPDPAMIARRRHYAVPARRVADELGHPVLANVVMLGTLLALDPVCHPEALEEALQARFPQGVQVNVAALHRGLALGEELTPLEVRHDG